MHLLPHFALAATPGGPAVDDMLRLLGIAAIVFAFFKGLKSLVAKPAPPQATPPQAPAAAPTAQAPTTAAPAAPAPLPAPVATAPAATAVAKAAEPAQPEGITPEIIAIIAAAVATAFESAHRIVSIKSQSSYWEKSGRQSVLTSHRIR
jgi:hypothetical protein